MDAGNKAVDLAVTSCLYRLKQHPEVYNKVMQELRDNGIEDAVHNKTFTPQMLTQCEYLNLVIKESLRIDPPTIISAPYQTYEDVTLCGVFIPKGTKMLMNLGKNTFINISI